MGFLTHRFGRPGTSQPGPDAETLRGRSIRAIDKSTASQRVLRERFEYRFWCGRCGGLIDDGAPFFCRECRL
jgi:hypothetical protein